MNNDPYQTAIRALAQHAMTKGQMVRRLERANVSAEEVNAVVGRLEQNGWLDDERYARQFIESGATRKRWGPGKIRAELLRREIPDGVIHRIWSELGEQIAWTEIAEQIVARYDKNDSKERQRLARKLDRLGFPAVVITHVLGEILKESFSKEQ